MVWQVTLMRINTPTPVKPSCAFHNFVQKIWVPPIQEPQNTNVQTRDMECNLDQTTVMGVPPALILSALQIHWHFCFTLPFFSWIPKRIFQALITLLKPKYQQYQDIDSLVVWPAYSTIPRAGRCGCLIHHSATIKSILGCLWFSTSLGKFLRLPLNSCRDT